jgi:small-conductance mechanosensitive channel
MLHSEAAHMIEPEQRYMPRLIATIFFLLRPRPQHAIRIKAQTFIAALMIASHCLFAFAQAPKPSASTPAPAANAAPPEPAAPKAIAVTDIAVQAEAALAELRRFDNKARIEDLIETAGDELPALTREASLNGWEMRRLLTQNTALETIADLEQQWRDIELRATSITRDLTRGASQLDRDLADLAKLDATWDATEKAAVTASAPPEVLDRARDIGAAIAKAKKQIGEQRTRLLELQSVSADIGARAAQARQSLANASERAVARLLYRDSVPLWSGAFRAAAADNFSKEDRTDLLTQISALQEYAAANAKSFALHGLLLLGLSTVLFAARRKISELSETDGNLRRAKKVFDMPVTSALLIALLVSTWFYARPPRTLWIAFSVLGAAPVVIFARRVIEVNLYPVLYAIVGFYLANRLRVLLAPLPGVSRLMLAAEAVFLIMFLAWTLRICRLRPDAPPWVRLPTWRIIRLAAMLAMIAVIVSLAADIGGYVRLAELVMRTTLGSAYMAVVFYALTRVGEGVVQGLLYVPPISKLGMVQRHKMLLTHRINGWLKRIAMLAWIALTLQMPALLQPLIALAQSAWKASASIGSLTLSVGDVLSFFFIIWAAIMLSRFSRFVLEEEVFTKVRLDRGLPYAVSTMLHYIVLLSGLVLALGAIGVDMTKFTIVAGAFSVGIGFGLQNIVNNFVSGLIVLFERPIKVGDTIQMDDVIGRVEHIGIRASIVHSTAGAEVIIPNGKLISDKVTNWTLSNKMRQIIVPVVTKPDINVVQLKELLLNIARQNKLVAQSPPPEALFIKRGIDTFEFELRVWTDELDAWLEVKSDLITEINEALRQYELAAQAPATVGPEPDTD